MFQYPAISSIPKICRILTFFRFRFLIVTAVLSPVLLFNPGHEQVHDPLLFALRKLSSFRDMIPFLETPSAAAGTVMRRISSGSAFPRPRSRTTENRLPCADIPSLRRSMPVPAAAEGAWKSGTMSRREESLRRVSRRGS